MEARIAVEGTDGDRAALYDWLLSEPGLRGRVRSEPVPLPSGAMGSPTELVVQGVAALAGAGVFRQLARSLAVWLEQRRADVKITVSGPDGTKVSVSALRVTDPERILRTVLDCGTPSTTGQEER